MSGYTYACAPGMVPTNAGYVPYSGQIMYAMRGFGYDAIAQSATTGNLLVPMESSGNAPTPATVATAIGAFTPFLQPETADPSTTEVKAVAEQSPIAGIVEGAAHYLSNGNPPSTNACAPAQYIVLVTDGLPTRDLAAGYCRGHRLWRDRWHAAQRRLLHHERPGSARHDCPDPGGCG
jgi:type IV pilus assembly protein PilY1